MCGLSGQKWMGNRRQVAGRCEGGQRRRVDKRSREGYATVAPAAGGSCIIMIGSAPSDFQPSPSRDPRSKVPTSRSLARPPPCSTPVFADGWTCHCPAHPHIHIPIHPCTGHLAGTVVSLTSPLSKKHGDGISDSAMFTSREPAGHDEEVFCLTWAWV